MADKNLASDDVGKGIELQEMSAKSQDMSSEHTLPPIEAKLTRDLTIENGQPRDVTSKGPVEPEFPINIEFKPSNETRESSRPRQAAHDGIQRFSQPFDRSSVKGSARPPSFSGELDVSGTSLVVSPGVVPEEPCVFSECETVEDGGPAAVFDVMDEHPGIDAANQEAQALDTERKLDEALMDGDFDLIQQNVTPKTLTTCKTNALLKAFEVNKRLNYLVENAVNPETDEIETLSKTVTEFTCAFINPLRSDSDTRSTFQSCLDYVVDKAIDDEQKKFISHPVVYNLLNSRWYRSFSSVRKQPWTSARRWGYLFLNIWPVLDIILFPFLFALFFIVHSIKEGLRRFRETEICFVVTLINDAESSEQVFTLIKRTITYLICKYGYYMSSVNYSVILREGDNALTNINFEEVCSSNNALLSRVKALKNSSSSPRLYDDLCAARDAFKSPTVRKHSEKVLVVFTNGMMNMLGVGDKDLTLLLNEIKAMGVQIVPVGIGECPKVSELEKIASSNIAPLCFGEYQSSITLGKSIIQGVESKDIFELYLDYFTTPYFIFVRDSLSYLTLLGLHFALCLSPPTLAFSRLEWVILIFFLGRILIEVDQFMGTAKAVRKAAARPKSHQGSRYAVYSPADDTQIVTPSSKESGLLKKFASYFSDRWNMIDFIMLLIYIATFTLRIFTWAKNDKVSDNRPLAVAGYLYGIITMFLTLRVFGHVMECVRGMGAILIAFFFIMWDVLAIFWQFLAMILAFSLAMTKIYVVEKAFTSNRTLSEDMACNDEGFVCWWAMAKHLAWSCLGMTGLEALDSIDHPTMTLSYLLYSLFLIMVVILLVNMMIALLSNTYEQVQDNSLKEWSFKKAITIRSYSSYHPVPVPFNLISILVMGLWKLCRCCDSEGNRFEKTGFDEREMRVSLDNLVERLEKTYFATYGYSFPLTDERKIDQLLHETDGSRQMANQIVHRVFRQQCCKQDKCVMGSSAWESLGIEIQGCQLTYEGPDFCNSCKGQEPKIIHGARYLMPFTRETPRIEVLIQESGERRILAVGAVFANYNCHRMPGWEGGTVGYHVDDGKIFEPGCDELGREVEDAMAHRGDLIACEVDFDGATNRTFPVVFFLNGREVARASMKRTAGQMSPFPFIAMGYQGIRVLAQMCPRERGTCVAQESHAAPTQRLTRDAGIEQELTHYVRQQYEMLREEIGALQLDRKAQAMELQEKLNCQEKMLAEIRELVKKERGDNKEFVSAL